MKKLGKFFKLIFQFILAILLVILVFIFIFFSIIFGVFEAVFRCGRRLFVAFLTGIIKGYQKEEKIKTVMQSTMKSKRTH
jgi:hypothetical protein